MGERRTLKDGLKPAAEIDPTREKEFVFRKDEPGRPPETPGNGNESKNQKTISRVPLTTRVRVDYATALKRASLERQLASETPNTLQDILEAALEPWLRDHGYIK